jgi:hypothetical protein
MPNPSAPVEGAGRRIPFLVDPANPGTAYLAAGEGAIDMGTGRTDAAAALIAGRGIAGTPAGGVLTVQGVAAGTPLAVGNKVVVVSATPTIDAGAYTAGDCLHTAVISFANAVGANLSGVVEKMILIDNAVQSAATELWLFSATVTPAAALDPHSISDAHAALCIGVIASGTYYASALNSVSVTAGLHLPIKCAASTLFGILVTRGTPTYAATDALTVVLQVTQD